MRKQNPTIRWHVTEAEKGKIRELSLTGLSATAVGKRLGLTRNTVAHWKREMGLPIWPALPEEKILALLRERVPPRAVAKALKVSYRGVSAFAREHGFGRRSPRQLSSSQVVELIADIVERRGSAASLARKYKWSYHKTLSLAHRLLKCAKFLPVARNPLRSDLPSRAPLPLGETSREVDFIELIGMVSRCLPEEARNLQKLDPAAFFNVCLAVASAYIPQELAPVKVEIARANLSAGIQDAMMTLRASAEGWKN